MSDEINLEQNHVEILRIQGARPFINEKRIVFP